MSKNMIRLGAMHDAIMEHKEQTKVINGFLKSYGPSLVREAVKRCGSLRATSRAVGLSPTYLSRVATKGQQISQGAYLSLAKIVFK